jgi:hypothetical protein
MKIFNKSELININCPACDKKQWIKENCSNCNLQANFILNGDFYYYGKTYDGKYRVEWVLGKYTNIGIINNFAQTRLVSFKFLLPFDLSKKRIERFIYLKDLLK